MECIIDKKAAYIIFEFEGCPSIVLCISCLEYLKNKAAKKRSKDLTLDDFKNYILPLMVD